MPDFAAPELPDEEEEQLTFERRLRAVSVLLSWYSVPASSMAASLAANPASGGHMLHMSPIQAWLLADTGGTAQWGNTKKKTKDYAFQRQFNGKPSITPGCPGPNTACSLLSWS